MRVWERGGGVKNAFMHKLFGFVFSWVCLCISVFVCFVCIFVCFRGLGEGGFKRWLLHCRNRVLLVTDTIQMKTHLPFFWIPSGDMNFKSRTHDCHNWMYGQYPFCRVGPFWTSFVSVDSRSDIILYSMSFVKRNFCIYIEHMHAS